MVYQHFPCGISKNGGELWVAWAPLYDIWIPIATAPSLDGNPQFKDIPHGYFNVHRYFFRDFFGIFSGYWNFFHPQFILAHANPYCLSVYSVPSHLKADQIMGYPPRIYVGKKPRRYPSSDLLQGGAPVR